MEEDKFIAIVNEYRSLIYKVCNAYCRDRGKRKDLEQEILLQLWRSFKTYDGRVKLTTWIYRVALNTAISFYRSDRKHNRTLELDTEIISLSDNGAEAENEAVNHLFRFIETLNELNKALMLLYLDDNSHKEIAEVLGISETNVGTKIARIKKAMKQELLTNKNLKHGTE